MQDAKVEARIRRKFRLVAIELDERRRRQWAAAEARDAGWGGISFQGICSGTQLASRRSRDNSRMIIT